MNKKNVFGIILSFVLILGIVFWLGMWSKKQEVAVKNQQKETMKDDASSELYGNINTRLGYDKSLGLIKEKGDFKLIDINSNKNSPRVDYVENRIFYTFYSDSKKINTVFNYDTGEVSSNDELAVKNSQTQLRIVPDNVILFGVEGVLSEVSKNSDFISYKKQYPELFDNYTINIISSDQFGWEWRYAVSKIVQGSRPKLLSFAINPETKKVTLVKKMGFDGGENIIQQK